MCAGHSGLRGTPLERCNRQYEQLCDDDAENIPAACSDLQVALERLAIVEKQRQSAVEELQALHACRPVSSPPAAAGALNLQAALDKARADFEAAQFRASEAEAALAALTAEQQARQVGALFLV